VSVRQEEDRLAFDVTARSLARFVELTLEGADAVFSPPSTGSELALNAVKGQALAGIFDDNYFDLPAGRTATVTCPLPAGWTVEQAQAALRVRSLYDSFA
jgi:beta-mannosidase